MATLDKLDRQIEGIHEEMIRQVLLSSFISVASSKVESARSDLTVYRLSLQCPDQSLNVLEAEPENNRPLIPPIEETTGECSRETGWGGRTAQDGPKRNR
jgi:hypothetical protein